MQYKMYNFLALSVRLRAFTVETISPSITYPLNRRKNKKSGSGGAGEGEGEENEKGATKDNVANGNAIACGSSRLKIASAFPTFPI